MNNGHPISDEVLDLADMALSKGKHWMAYNQSLYFIEKRMFTFLILDKQQSIFNR